MYSMTQRVCISHTDADGRLKLASALDMMQDCSQCWIDSEPVFHDFLVRDRVTLLLASRQIDVVRTPVYRERLTVRTSVYSCQRAIGLRNTVIYDERDAPCILSWCVGVFVSVDLGKMVKLPPDVAESMAIDPQVDMDYLDKKIVLPACDDAREFPPIPVNRGDIDFNRHVNNARYVEASMEFLPEDFATTRLRIEYKTAARLGDALHPRVMQPTPNCCVVTLGDAAGKPYTVAEFSRRG